MKHHPIFAAVLSILLLAGCGSPSGPTQSEPSGVEMPSLDELALDEALAVLEESGAADPTIENRSAKRMGTAGSVYNGNWVVEDTSPEAGEFIAVGDVPVLSIVHPDDEGSQANVLKAAAQAEEEEQRKQNAAREKREEDAAAKAEAEAAARKKAEAEAVAKAKAEEEARAAEALKPVIYEGYGDDVLAIDKKKEGFQPARIHHTGFSNFAVQTLDTNLEMTDLLVNTIGNYSGVVAFDDSFGGDGGETSHLQITADGGWKIELIPLQSLPSYDGSTPIQGVGDAIFRYAGDSAAASISYPGPSNIALIQHSLNPELRVNDIGPYDGTVIMQTGLFELIAEGAWSITIR